MTQEDILEMARSAGLTDGIELQHEIDAVVRFAELVAAAEREACAVACENEADGEWFLLMSDPYSCVANCAAVIRARGDA